MHACIHNIVHEKATRSAENIDARAEPAEIVRLTIQDLGHIHGPQSHGASGSVWISCVRLNERNCCTYLCMYLYPSIYICLSIHTRTHIHSWTTHLWRDDSLEQVVLHMACPLCMYVCVCVCVRACMCVYIYIYVCMYVCMYVSIYLSMHIYIYIYIYIYMFE